MAILLQINGRDATKEAEQLTFSTVDPGGFESLSCALTSAFANTPKGARVMVTEGAEIIWDGRVTEIEQTTARNRTQVRLAAQGFRASLAEQGTSMVYVDRSLSAWTTAPSTSRQIRLLPSDRGGNSLSSAQLVPDGSTPAALLRLTAINNSNVAPRKRDRVEGWYDAGPNNTIEKIWYDIDTSDRNASTGTSQGQLGGLWDIRVQGFTDNINGYTNDTGNLSGTFPTTGTFEPSGNCRYAAIFMFYNASYTNTAGSWSVWFRNPAVFGPHKLNPVGTMPSGLYPADIAKHAISQLGNSQLRVVADPSVGQTSGYAIPHAVYRDYTTVEQIVTDMAGVLGWHWGVWEPSPLSEQPRFLFQPPPTSATATVDATACEPISVTDRLDGLYNKCVITYANPDGVAVRTEVSRVVPELDAQGITRVLNLTIGISNETAAKTFGNFMLAISQTQARGGGSATLPGTVTDNNGNPRAAYLLKAGRDRIRISGLTNLRSASPLSEVQDLFRVARTETTVERGGLLRTRIDFDGGTNLTDVLQARLAVAANIA